MGLRNKMVALTCVPTDLYDHVYGFLVENGLLKTARKFKNEVSQEVKQPSGPGLVEIFSTFFNSVQPGILKEAVNENDNLKSNISNENTNNVNIGAVKKSKKNKKRKQDEEINSTDAKKAKKDNADTSQREPLSTNDDKVQKTKKEKKKKKKVTTESTEDANSITEEKSQEPIETIVPETTEK